MVTTLLIANRGEIACRIIRSARSLGIHTVAVYSDPDARALHVELADDALALRGDFAADTYLSTDKLLAAAAAAGADAVHPGYGFLSENAAFAQRCLDAGHVWVGPSPHVIATMGDKLRAKTLMSEAGVPVLPSFAIADVPDDAFPVLVKAVAGGGGKGMRLVSHRADLQDAVVAAAREAAAAFGDDRLFVESFLRRPHHIEVQVLGDVHGNVVHLGERECSIQRRHQKVIEESPSPFVDDALRAQLCDAALAGARALGYTSAGTFEFVVSGDRRIAFLEVNTRLQVEHPVTELAWMRADGTPLDLVALQLAVARGEPLPFSQDEVVARAHAIEARLYAEDVAAGFLPATGAIALWDIAEGARVDAGVRTGDEVTPHYDPLLAKLIATAPTRREAAARLAGVLSRSRIHGVTTNRDFLVGALRHPAFMTGDYDTGFVGDHVDWGGTAAEVHEAHAVAVTLGRALQRQPAVGPLATIPLGWRNNRSQPGRARYRTSPSTELVVDYVRERDGTFTVACGTTTQQARVIASAAGAVDVELGDRRIRARWSTSAGDVFIDSSLGSSRLTIVPRFRAPDAAVPAGALIAPMPGTVVSVAVTEGDAVAPGALLLVLEAMKMEHRLTAPAAGLVRALRVAVGDRVAAGDLLVVLNEEER